MKAIFIDSPVSRVVDYYGITDVPLARGESFITADKDGQIWAYHSRPFIRGVDRDHGQWSIQRGDRLPRCIGHVELEEVNWIDSLVDYGADPKDE